MIGRTLSHYNILEKLGSGGMGVVYVAEDTKLGRQVALKVLPTEMASGERLSRFECEAKAVAALNHPNIVTIYSVEEAEGVHFITMEVVRGQTLSELIPKKGLALSKFFDIAIPLADAVSAAHQQGITHRDLKPDNLMLNQERRLKILDFGLAKLKPLFGEEAASELPTQSVTQEGRIIGTVAYMSPEQAEGKQVDHRSDIFSIGIILYEMVTGQRPFKGETATSILSSILKDAPVSATEVNPALPSLLGRIIRRCLAKDPSRRYQTALDVRNELEELKQDVDSGEVLEGTPSPPISRVKPWRFAAVVTMLVLALAAVLTYILRQPAETVPRLTNPTQVTSAVGVENYPTWSPDGRTLAYESNQGGNWDIWATQLGGGEPVNRTADHKGSDRFPSWSPDGSQIAFVSEREGSGVYLMSALGSRPRKVLSTLTGDYYSTPQWSADGTEIACLAFDSGRAFVEIVTLSSREIRRLSLPSRCVDLSWSPDGSTFAYVASPAGYSADVNQIRVLAASGGETIPVTEAWTNDWSPSWSRDERKLFFVSNRGGSMDLWQQPMDQDGKPEGEASPLTTGLVIRSAVFSPDGSKLGYSRYRQGANVWRAPILRDRPATWADARQITFDEANIEYFNLSPDGKRLAIASDRSGNKDIWLLPSGGGEMEQLTTDPTPDWGPSWSPDGKKIAFHAYRSGNRDIWVMPVGGGPAQQLTLQESAEANVTWSPDSREFAFISNHSGNWDIWTIPAEGGEPRQLTVHPNIDNYPTYTPGGKWIVFESRRDGVFHLWRIPSAGGPAERMVEGRRPTWSPDGKQLFFRKAGNVWALSVEDDTEYQVTDFVDRTGLLGTELAGGGLATDGQYIYFVWREDIGDIWVMDVIYENGS